MLLSLPIRQLVIYISRIIGLHRLILERLAYWIGQRAFAAYFLLLRWRIMSMVSRGSNILIELVENIILAWSTARLVAHIDQDQRFVMVSNQQVCGLRFPDKSTGSYSRAQKLFPSRNSIVIVPMINNWQCCVPLSITCCNLSNDLAYPKLNFTPTEIKFTVVQFVQKLFTN